MEQTQLYEDFFQISNSYYLEKLKLVESGKRFSFNYAAFLLGTFWFLYRKMYLESLLIILIFMAEFTFENYILVDLIGAEQTKLVGFLFTVFFGISLGFIGNLLYINKSKRMVKKATQKYSDYEQQKEYLNKKGGTTYLYVVILIILIVLSSVIK
jgi:hypothetical protein